MLKTPPGHIVQRPKISPRQDLRAAAVRAGMPADVITEVDGRMMPTGNLAAVS